MFASNIPNARNCVAVLTLTESGTTTAVVKVDKGVDTFVVAGNQARNGAGRETFRARGQVARTVLSLLISEAFAPTAVVVFVIALVVVVVVVTGFSRFGRWFRWTGGVRRSRWTVAAKRVVGPLPAVVTLRRRAVIGGRLVRSATI